MNWGGPEFVLWIVGISTVGWIITSWIRAKHGYPLEGEWGGVSHRVEPEQDRKIELLSTENAKLEGKVMRLEERIAVLERIATDAPARLTSEIDSLR